MSDSESDLPQKEDVSLDPRVVSRRNALLITSVLSLSLASSIMWIVVFATNAVSSYSSRNYVYTSESSCLDVAVADWIISFVLVSSILIPMVLERIHVSSSSVESYPPDSRTDTGTSQSSPAGDKSSNSSNFGKGRRCGSGERTILSTATRYVIVTVVAYATLWFFLAMLSKFWVYRGWGDKSSLADSICFLISIVTIAVRTVFVFQIEDPRKAVERVPFYWGSVFRILRPYIYPSRVLDRLIVLVVFVALGCSKAADIISPILLGMIIGKITAPPSAADGSTIAPEDFYTDDRENEVYRLVVAYCMLCIAPSIFAEIQDVSYVKVGQIAFTEVAEMSFAHVHQLSIDWHLRKKMGHVIRSVNRGQAAADLFMYSGVVTLAPAILTAIATFIVFAVKFDQPLIAGACFFGFMTYCWVTGVVTIWKRQFREEMNVSDNQMHDKSSDSLVNFETVKYFNNEEFEVKGYLALVKEYQKGGYATQASTSIMNVSQSLSIHFSIWATLSVAVFCVLNKKDRFDVEAFVSVQAYIFTIFTPLQYIGFMYNNVINALTDIQNLSELLSETADIVDKPSAIDFQQVNSSNKPVSIRFNNVHFRYPAQPEGSGIKGVSFDVPAGTMTAIVGETGSGKTTLSRLLFRFYDVSSGEITLNGVNVADMTQASLRKAIGVVPQDTVLFNDTVAYNIRYGKLDASDEEVVEASKRAQVHRFIDKLENKYDTVVGERGLKLSGGEKQRLSIARCLLKNPPVVLLDEATSALDNKTERELQRALQCLAGRTTLVIAHRLTTIKDAQQIIVMRNGVIVERGTHDELLGLGPSGYYHSMWFTQLVEEEKKDEDEEMPKEASDDDEAAPGGECPLGPPAQHNS